MAGGTARVTGTVRTGRTSVLHLQRVQDEQSGARSLCGSSSSDGGGGGVIHHSQGDLQAGLESDYGIRR